MRKGESKTIQKSKRNVPEGVLPLRLSTTLLGVLVPFYILCEIYLWNIKIDIFYRGTVHNPQAGKNASNPIRKHLHGVNHDSIKHLTTFVSVVAEVSCVLKLYTVHAYKQLGMSFIVFFFFPSQKVLNGVWYIEKKRRQCLCRDCCKNVWLEVEASVCFWDRRTTLYICRRRSKLYFKVSYVYLRSLKTWLDMS